MSLSRWQLLTATMTANTVCSAAPTTPAAPAARSISRFTTRSCMHGSKIWARYDTGSMRSLPSGSTPLEVFAELQIQLRRRREQRIAAGRAPDSSELRAGRTHGNLQASDQVEIIGKGVSRRSEREQLPSFKSRISVGLAVSSGLISIVR